MWILKKEKRIIAFYFKEFTINGKIRPALRNQFKDNKMHTAIRCQAYNATRILPEFTGGREGGMSWKYYGICANSGHQVGFHF